jgi:hypothetical protein
MEERREEARMETASRTDAVREQQGERRNTFTDALKERAYHLFTNMERRMEAAIERLTNIADRMETRAKKLNERGIDTSEAVKHIEEARAKLDEAALMLEGIDFVSMLGADKPREQFGELRESVRAVKGLIREAHQSLRNALAALRAALTDADRAARDEAASDEAPISE